MSIDMLRIVVAAEEEAFNAKQIAEQRAQIAINEAKKAGEDAITSTLVRAESEIAHLIRASDIKATEEAKELASSIANRIATQQARAERRLEAAAQLIVERIVGV